MRNSLHRRRSQPHDSSSRKRGGTFVEFALVIPLFFLLTFAIVDFGYLFFLKLTLENAVRQAGRYAITGNSLSVTNGTTGVVTTDTRIQSITQIAQNAAPGFPITVNISSVQAGTTTTNSAGGPGSFVTVSISTDYTFWTHFIGKFFPNGQYAFTVSTTFRNEDFPAADTN
jgi:Flp pilus assembly protein TadG